MKKIYTLLFLFMCLSATSFAQMQRSFKGQTANPANRDWSDPANWVNNLPPSSPGDSVILNVAAYPMADTTNVDVNFTIRRLANSSNANRNILVTSSPNAVLTVDVNSDVLYFSAPAFAIQHTSTAAYTFKIDGHVKIANSFTASNTNGNQSDIRVSGNNNNIIEFGPNSILELAGNGATAAHVIQGGFVFNGRIQGTQGLIFSGNAGNSPIFTFGAGSNNAMYTSPGSVFTLNNGVTVIANTADNGSFFAGDKILSSGATTTLTLNGANILASRLQLSTNSQFTVNINRNQTGLKEIDFLNATTAKLKLMMNAAVTQLYFTDNSAANWTNGTVEISGFKEGVIRFGTSNGGLTQAQLSQIKDAANPSDQFYLTSTGFLTKVNTLPVTLTNLSAKGVDQSVLLSWITQSENNSSRFEIMRSGDGQHFVAIGTVKAAGNSNAELSYSFRDEKPLAGINYYRLNQYDVNGKLHSSKVVAANAQPTKLLMKVVATTSQLVIKLNNAVAGKATVGIYDASGRVVWEQPSSLVSGNNTITINKSLDRAVYFVKVASGPTVLTQKCMVQ